MDVLWLDLSLLSSVSKQACVRNVRFIVVVVH
jgi:hypothetical protein